jgi:uncharacterized membrane protein
MTDTVIVAMIGAVTSIASVVSTIIIKMLQKNQEETDKIHEIVNSQRTAMTEEITYLKRKVDNLESLLSPKEEKDEVSNLAPRKTVQKRSYDEPNSRESSKRSSEE